MLEKVLHTEKSMSFDKSLALCRSILLYKLFFFLWFHLLLIVTHLNLKYGWETLAIIGSFNICSFSNSHLFSVKQSPQIIVKFIFKWTLSFISLPKCLIKNCPIKNQINFDAFSFFGPVCRFYKLKNFSTLVYNRLLFLAWATDVLINYFDARVLWKNDTTELHWKQQ